MNSKKLFDNYLETAPIGQEGKDQSVSKIKWIKYNLARFFPEKDAYCLDIGPGKGEVLLVLKEMGYVNISSVDISRDVCEYIVKSGFDCMLVENTAMFLEKNNEKFDLIILNDVVEHIPKAELVNLIQAVYLSLKKDGKVIIKVPNAQSPHFSIGRYGDLTHEQSFTETSLNQLLRSGGFSSFEFLPEKQSTKGSPKAFISRYLIMPLYFWFVRKLRATVFHASPEILTQAIIAVGKK